MDNKTKQREFDSSTDELAERTHAPGFANPNHTDSTAGEMYADVLTPDKELPPEGPKRAGYTKNKGKPRSKARARMAKVSRVRNRR